ncbi:MAG: Gfo/Idh/MocA family oxidoreductase [Alphaproteobacteria bacterium]|nr:Gfo/Idh/MocA family oxidoreductase [Alphaproteobacteria bacterium]
MDKVRTAVIGTGHFGRYHADKYAKSPLSQFVGIVDADAGTRDTVAGKYGVAAFADHRELIGKVDAVSVVVPTVLHHDGARALIDPGIHVLIEKPIPDAAEQGRAPVALADRPSVGCLGSSILQGLGRPEWIARSEAEYIDKAAALAADHQALSALRAGLRQAMQASILMDEAGVAPEGAQAYRPMFKSWGERGKA